MIPFLLPTIWKLGLKGNKEEISILPFSRKRKTTEVRQFLFWEHTAPVVLHNKAMISTH